MVVVVAVVDVAVGRMVRKLLLELKKEMILHLLGETAVAAAAVAAAVLIQVLEWNRMHWNFD